MTTRERSARAAGRALLGGALVLAIILGALLVNPRLRRVHALACRDGGRVCVYELDRYRAEGTTAWFLVEQRGPAAGGVARVRLVDGAAGPATAYVCIPVGWNPIAVPAPIADGIVELAVDSYSVERKASARRLMHTDVLTVRAHHATPLRRWSARAGVIAAALLGLGLWLVALVQVRRWFRGVRSTTRRALTLETMIEIGFAWVLMPAMVGHAVVSPLVLAHWPPSDLPWSGVIAIAWTAASLAASWWYVWRQPSLPTAMVQRG